MPLAIFTLRRLRQFVRTTEKTEWYLLLRLGLLYGLVLLQLLLHQSGFVEQLLHRQYADPQILRGGTEVLLATLLLMFWMMRCRLYRTKPVAWPSLFQVCVAAELMVFVNIASVYLTHPSAAMLKFFGAAEQDNLVFLTAIGASLYSVQLVSLPLMALLLFPFAFLKAHWRSLGGIWLLTLLFPFSEVINVAYHQFAVAAILAFGIRLLSLFSPNVYADPVSSELMFDGFHVIIGPVCLGTGSLILFTICYSFLCALIRQKSGLQLSRAVIAFVAGVLLLFMLNILRIVSIMLVGASAPELGVALFHGAIGAVLFFLVFVGYVKWVMPWVQLRSDH